jgi:hypothetical protein
MPLQNSNIQMRIYLLILFTALFLNSQSQNDYLKNTGQLWSEVDFKGDFTTKLKWQLDVQYSRQSPYEQVNLFKYNSQLTIRPWLHFFLTPSIKISAFVGLWYNYAIQDVGAREFPEYRTAIQANFYKTKNRDLLIKRCRVELREIKDRQGIFETVLRERFMLKYQHLLNHESYDKNALYFFSFDELFINSGSKVTGYHLFDQNRLFVGIGYNLTNDITFETGYFNQLQQYTHASNMDINHIWQVTFILDNISFRHI